MKNIRLLFVCIYGFVFCLFSCAKEESGYIDYDLSAKSKVGLNLIQKTDLFATIFSDSAYKIAEGMEAVDIHYFSKKGLSMHIHVLEIDLTVAGVSVEVSTPNNGTKFGLQKMSEQAVFKDSETRKVRAGINGSFFDTKTGAPRGLFCKEGNVISICTDDYPNFFAITKEGKPIIATSTDYENLKTSIYEAVGGGVLLVKEGAVVFSNDDSVNPRTCIGISEDGSKIYALLADGRYYTYSNGMTYQELSECMLAIGAYYALNLDGGGSTTYVVRSENTSSENRFQVRNRPSENGGMERNVANGIVFISNND